MGKGVPSRSGPREIAQSPCPACWSQLWAVPSSPQSAICPTGAPSCLCALTHQGAVTWDLQVRPLRLEVLAHSCVHHPHASHQVDFSG